jgi:PPOX class probable F420-dependent enzyme
MPEKMTDEQCREFMIAGTRTATVATVREDGRPHAVPVWFALDGDDIVITTQGGSVKARNLLRDPRVTVVVDDATPPYSFVSIDGTAEFSQDEAELRRWAAEIARKYTGEEGVEGFVGYAVHSRMSVVRIRPNHKVGYDKIAGS